MQKVDQRPLPGPEFLVGEGGDRIAYRRSPGAAPGVLFLGGLRSDMTGTKALFHEAVCRREGRAFIRFDYTGHGASDGGFEDGTIGGWLADARAVLDGLAGGPQILVGSSLGGWIAFLLAKERPDKVAAILGISAAVDFTAYVHDMLFEDKHRKQLLGEGRVLVPDCHGGPPFAITRKLVEEGRDHLLLDREAIPIRCPVRLIHARQDRDVAWDTGLRLADKLAGVDVRVVIVKDGRHQLARPGDLRLQEGLLLELLEQFAPGEGARERDSAAPPPPGVG